MNKFGLFISFINCRTPSNIYIYMCVFVCVCVCEKYFVCLLLFGSFQIPDKCFRFRLELVGRFTEIGPSAIDPS